MAKHDRVFLGQLLTEQMLLDILIVSLYLFFFGAARQAKGTKRLESPERVAVFAVPSPQKNQIFPNSRWLSRSGSFELPESWGFPPGRGFSQEVAETKLAKDEFSQIQCKAGAGCSSVSWVAGTVMML